MKSFILNIILLAVCLISGYNSAFGQFLLASEMNIYFGHPKTISQTVNGNTVLFEFDQEGRLMKSKQGNMSIEYKWADDNSSVTLSIFSGTVFSQSQYFEIVEFTKECLKYKITGYADMSVSFDDNGRVNSTLYSNPQISTTSKFIYKSEEDMFPYSVENSNGKESMSISIIVDEIDNMGNAIKYTRKSFGNEEKVVLNIEYYE